MEGITFTISSAYQLIVQKLNYWGKAFIFNLPNFLVALLVFILFIVIARFVKRLVVNISFKFSPNVSIAQLFGAIASLTIVCAGLFIALGILKLDKMVFSLLAGVGVLGIALGFAFQDIASNFISSVILIIEKPFKEGDIVETNGKLGVVVSIDLRTTRLRSFDGQEILIPNMKVFKETSVNYTSRGERRVVVELKVAYDTDLKKLIDLTKRTLGSLPFVLPRRNAEVEYTSLAGNAIALTANFWVAYPGGNLSYGEAKTHALIALKEAYDSEGIKVV